jgi:hypothetical protein
MIDNELNQRSAEFANEEGRRAAQELYRRHNGKVPFEFAILATAAFHDAVTKGYGEILPASEVAEAVQRDVITWSRAAARELRRLHAESTATRH